MAKPFKLPSFEAILIDTPVNKKRPFLHRGAEGGSFELVFDRRERGLGSQPAGKSPGSGVKGAPPSACVRRSATHKELRLHTATSLTETRRGREEQRRGRRGGERKVQTSPS